MTRQQAFERLKIIKQELLIAEKYTDEQYDSLIEEEQYLADYLICGKQEIPEW